MATKKQLAALKKAREARRLKSKYGLHGIGFGNLKSINKNEVMDMVKTTGAIVLGYVGSEAIGKLVAKAIVKDEAGFKKYIEPMIQIGGGFLVSATGKKNNFVKMLGAGMMAKGAVNMVEKAAGKTIMELVGIAKNSEATQAIEGLGKAIDEIELIDFKPELPELRGEFEKRDIDFRGADDEDLSDFAVNEVESIL